MSLEEAENEMYDLVRSWEYAFAFGSGCSIGDHPHFAKTRERYYQLVAIIREHRAD